jgi:hypothetical protein
MNQDIDKEERERVAAYLSLKGQLNERERVAACLVEPRTVVELTQLAMTSGGLPPTGEDIVVLARFEIARALGLALHGDPTRTTERTRALWEALGGASGATSWASLTNGLAVGEVGDAYWEAWADMAWADMRERKPGVSPKAASVEMPAVDPMRLTVELSVSAWAALSGPKRWGRRWESPFIPSGGPRAAMVEQFGSTFHWAVWRPIGTQLAPEAQSTEESREEAEEAADNCLVELCASLRRGER